MNESVEDMGSKPAASPVLTQKIQILDALTSQKNIDDHFVRQNHALLMIFFSELIHFFLQLCSKFPTLSDKITTLSDKTPYLLDRIYVGSNFKYRKFLAVAFHFFKT